VLVAHGACSWDAFWCVRMRPGIWGSI
jgi:hypothetical protein